mmetsp:Transcript_9754/g.26440  ORF Transcript_9754/g.26440 Transcript_9754/m.26440 type:complete len:272 (-) Transcript_9754:1036-1851(-)
MPCTSKGSCTSYISIPAPFRYSHIQPLLSGMMPDATSHDMVRLAMRVSRPGVRREAPIMECLMEPKHIGKRVLPTGRRPSSRGWLAWDSSSCLALWTLSGKWNCTMMCGTSSLALLLAIHLEACCFHDSDPKPCTSLPLPPMPRILHCTVPQSVFCLMYWLRASTIISVFVSSFSTSCAYLLHITNTAMARVRSVRKRSSTTKGEPWRYVSLWLAWWPETMTRMSGPGGSVRSRTSCISCRPWSGAKNSSTKALIVLWLMWPISTTCSPKR